MHSGIIDNLRCGGMRVCPDWAGLTPGDPPRFLLPDSQGRTFLAEVEDLTVWAVATQDSFFRMKPPSALTRSLSYPQFVPSWTPKSGDPRRHWRFFGVSSIHPGLR